MTTAEKLIKARVAETGAISVDEFMSIVISYYYQKQNPFGVHGDFITAPEISQMFGEIIGMWCVNYWLESGKPNFNFIEIGPGQGTLMSDILRVGSKFDGFYDVLQHVFMIENSSRLIELQQQKLINYKKCKWVGHIDKAEDGFNIIVCNEFFDALPIKQFIKRGTWFYEIKVGLFDKGLSFFESEEKFKFEVDCVEGAIIEVSPVSKQYALSIASKLKGGGGGALIVDYGYINSAYNSTLQAVKKHTYHDVFKDIGEADITAHVDFSALKDVFLQQGFDAAVMTQGKFLVENGIKFRAQQLINAGAQSSQINADLERLISSAQMGELFKILCVTNKIK